MADLLRPKDLLQMASDAELAEMEKERLLKTKKQERELDREGFATVLAGRFGIRLDDVAIARLATLGASPVAAAL